jgi:hypothetical protein
MRGDSTVAERIASLPACSQPNPKRSAAAAWPLKSGPPMNDYDGRRTAAIWTADLRDRAVRVEVRLVAAGWECRIFRREQLERRTVYPSAGPALTAAAAHVAALTRRGNEADEL